MVPDTPDRCRLVLINPSRGDPRHIADRLAEAVAGGDVASVVLQRGELEDSAFERLCERSIPPIQSAGAAAVIAGTIAEAERFGADGVHLEDRGLLAKFPVPDTRLIIGAGGVKSRDDALVLGELRPDYLFFGRFGYDTDPEPHPRNLKLGEWWSQLVEIPCIVLAGCHIESVEKVAATGAEFVAASSAIFAGTQSPGEAVRRTNALLDETAPRFGADP